MMASMLRMSSSKNILDSTVHQFQEVVIYFSDGPASQFKLICCLALHSLEEIVGTTSLLPVMAKAIRTVLDEQ